MVMVTSPMSSTSILSSPTGPRLVLTMLAMEEAARTFCVLTSEPVFLSPGRLSDVATVLMVTVFVGSVRDKLRFTCFVGALQAEILGGIFVIIVQRMRKTI